MIDANSDGVAIVGMACVVPGASNYRDYWHSLCRSEVAYRRSSWKTRADSDVPELNRGELHEAEWFDAARFDINEQEAAIMDPQVRQFLHVVDSAFADAGYPGGRGLGLVAVTASQAANHGYHDLLSTLRAKGLVACVPELLESVHKGTDFLATRVSFAFDLRGPSFNVQSGCSSSLLAVAEAVHLLLAGRCDAAVAGGMTITYPLQGQYTYETGSIYSKTGECRPFDRDADGTVPSNGGGAVVLKLLKKARADGDRIHAIIRGAGVNNDGSRKVSFAAPSADGQYELLRRTYGRAGVAASKLSFIECHATGTFIGDPIEVVALKRLMVEEPAASTAIVLGSVKGNIGHLFWSSGVASLIKAALSLQHRCYPGTANLAQPNGLLDIEGSCFVISGANVELSREGPLFGAVSSFGVGGTNVHLILERGSEIATEGALPARVHHRARKRYTLLPADVVPDAAAPSDSIPNVRDVLPAIVVLYQRTFGDVAVTSESDYFELNGDSIGAVELIGKIESTFGVSLEQDDIYRFRTPARLAEAIGQRIAALSTPAPDIEATTGVLNIFQTRFYLLEKLQRGSVSQYNVPICFEVDASFDLDRFVSVVSGILTGLPTFARTLTWTADGVKLGERRRSITEVESIEVANDIETSLRALFGKRFALEAGPVARISELQSGLRRYLVLNIPHLLIDGTGMHNLLRCISLKSVGAACAPTVAVRSDASKKESEASAVFWSRYLRDAAPTRLGSDREPDAATTWASELVAALPAHLIARMNEVCRREGLTLFVLCYAAFNLLLSQRTGHQAVLTGTTLGNRSAGSSTSIDCLINNVPVLVKLRVAESAWGVLQRTRRALADVTRYANIPLNDIVRSAGITKAPYHVLFMFQNQNAGYQLDLDDRSYGESDYRYRPLYCDLCLNFARRGEALSVSALFDPNRHSEKFVGNFLNDYQELLNWFVEDLLGDTFDA